MPKQRARLLCGEAIAGLSSLKRVRMIFADPPDNIGLKYKTYKDRMANKKYRRFIEDLIGVSTQKCEHFWMSYNALHDFWIGGLVDEFLRANEDWTAIKCVQTFTFYQHNRYDLGNAHRPMIRMSKVGASLYPEAIRIPSWRLLNKDVRGNPAGKVPGDVFDFPRVTGNSKQRRSWHPTQINEGVIERCVKLCARPVDTICDPFAGTGTLLRVCKRTNNPCILMDVDREYCERIAMEHEMKPKGDNEWKL